MNFYKHHLGDYADATAHLSWDEDLAYRRLLSVYYRNEGPIPVSQAYRLVRAVTPAQKKAVAAVLREFFTNGDGCWKNSRADEEIAAYQAKASLSRAVGKLGGNPYWEQQYEHPGQLYAARIDETRVKVGITKNWKIRRPGLERTYGKGLRLLSVFNVPCMGVAEDAVLDKFPPIPGNREVISIQTGAEEEALLAFMAGLCQPIDQPAGLVKPALTKNQIPRTKNQKDQKKGQGRATPLPANFKISERVKTWADAKGLTDLESDLEFFVGRMKANGKTYVDWDEAFMNCVREDWAGLREGKR